MLRSCDHTGKGAVRDALGRTGIERCAASSRAPVRFVVDRHCGGSQRVRGARGASALRAGGVTAVSVADGRRGGTSNAPCERVACASMGWAGRGRKVRRWGAWAVTPLALLRSNTSTRILQSRSIACARGLNSSPHGIISSSAAPSHLAGSRSAAACVKWQKIGHVENAAIAGWTRAVSSPLDRDEDEISKRC